MNPDVFFENFELLADAPNGVQKLRELILQLAVMGKLVPQDPNDEPANVLLERVIAEKEKLVREKVIRADSFARIEEDEILFKIPKSWEWVRLGQIGDWGAGSTPNRRNSDYFSGTIKWFKSGELNDGYITDSEEKITDLALKDCSLRLNKKSDVLIAMYGATIGKVAILDTEATTNQAVCACTCFTGVYNRYLFFLLKAYRQYFTSQGAGGAQPNISRIKIVNTIVPLPPLAEQKRIVSKVDELMALCDKLETRHQKKQEIQSKLNSAALDRMLSAENQEEFEQHWQRICENFDLLYDNHENVERLRQAILQLAVQGKLVPQNPEDEPASVLIEKIEAAKEKLAREGKSQKTKPLPEICLDELPYDLPDSWIWIRLGNAYNSLRYGTSKKCAYNITGSPVLRIPNIVNGKIDTSDLKFTQLSTKEIEDLRLDLGDLLLVRSNGSTSLVGRSAVINNNLNGYAYAGYLVRLRTFPLCISPDYLHLVLESSYVRDQIEMPIRTTSGVKNINSFEISRLILPISPLAEQKRIVEKVEQLMGLCDELEVKLRKERKDSEKLMEAVIKGLLEGAATGKTELEKPMPLQVAAIKMK